MRKIRTVAAVWFIATLLCACQKTPPAQPDSRSPSAAQAVPGTQAGSASETSVPPANTVLAPADAKPAEPAAAGRTNAAMSRAQESAAMPMPGQNNDHSAPLSTPKPATAASGR